MTMLDRKLLRELYRSRGLLLAIAAIIAVGITCFVSFRSAYHNLQQAKTEYYRQCRMADFWIDLKKAPLSEIASLREIAGIEQVTSRIGFFATADLQGVVKPISSLVLSVPDRRHPIVNDIILQAGTYFSAHRQNEVIVNAAFAREHRLVPGSRLHLLLNNRREELIVVGTALSSEFVYLLGPESIVPDPQNFGVFYVKRSYAEDVFDFAGAANQAVGRFAPGIGRNRQVVLQQAERLLEPFGVFTTILLKNQPSNLFLSSEIDGLGITATVMPAVFLLVAAVVLNVLITRLTRQQRVVIGTLKAIGYTDRQIFVHFLKFGITVGIAGSLAGSILGYLASMGMMVVYRQFFEFPELRSGFFWYTHVVGIAVALLCAVLGSVHGARSMLRLRPAESMRPEPPRSGGRILLERFSLFWRQLDSTWRMVLRGMARSRLRMAAGLFAAAMGAGLLVSGFIFSEIQSYLIDFQFFQIARSDINVTLNHERADDAWSEISRLPGVDSAEPVLNVACTIVHGPYRRKTAITGLLPTARMTVPQDRSGAPIIIPENGLVITSRLAEILHVKPADKVTLIPIKGQRRPVEAVVAKIAQSYMGLESYAQIAYLSRLVDSELLVTGVQIATDHNPAHLTSLYRRLKEMPGVQTVTSRQDMIRNLIDALVNNQYVFIFALILFSGIVFFGSIVNASLVSLAERQREVATFQALGYTTWQIGNMFLRENVLVNSIGTLLGLPFGYLLVRLTALAYSQNDLIRLPVVTAPWVWLATIGFAALFTTLAHGVVQWRIYHMDYLAALNVTE